MISPELIQAIRMQYQLPWNGLHGPKHWARVMENGLKLTSLTGAQTEVVELFAVFHDACRINEDWDENHGSRGADLAGIFRGKYFDLNDQDFIALKVACRLHTAGFTEGDVTVLTCWDADRLDLGRVGIYPDKRYLCTAAAKQPEILAWANERASSEFVPEFVDTHWMNPAPTL